MAEQSSNPPPTPRRKRAPGDEVESNLNERIDRAKRQEEEQQARVAGGEESSSGITDPRYQMKPLKNDLHDGS
jgi:hypothetical protein